MYSERSSSASGRRSLPARTALDVAIRHKSTISLILTFSLFSPTLGRMAQLMQVRQAARALGVHENTVRRWEERGLLRAVRLPSGVRRFRAEDVEAMHAQMFSGFAPLREDDDVVSVTRARSID
jgi:excisionase family DNA binding protein